MPTISDLLFGNAQEKGRSGLWNPNNCFILVGFGSDEDSLRALPTGSDLFLRWTTATLKSEGPFCPNDQDAARKIIADHLNRIRLAGKKYGLSTFLWPTLLSNQPTVFSRESIVVRVSDYSLDSPRVAELDAFPLSTYLTAQKSKLEESVLQFNSTFRVQRIEKHSSGPLQTEVFEIRPAHPPTLNWSYAIGRANEKRSGWQLELPDLILGDGASRPIISIRQFEVSVGSGLPRLTVPGAGNLDATRNVIHVGRLSVAREYVAGQEPTAEVRALFDYGTTVPYRLQIGVYAESKPLKLTLRYKPTLGEEILWYWGPSSLIVGFLTYFLFFRKPIVHLEEKAPSREVETPVGFLRKIEWSNEIHLITIHLRNRRRFLLRHFRTEAYIDVSELGQGRFKRIELQVEDAITGPGRPLAVAGEQDLILRIDMRGTDEPTQMIAPITVKLIVRSGRDDTRRDVVFALVPADGSFFLGIDPGTTGACIAGGDQVDDISLVPLDPASTLPEDRFVARSLIYICQKQDEVPGAMTYIRGELAVPYLAGHDAAAYADAYPAQVFRSAKRLIGYDNPKKGLKSLGRPVILQGRDAVQMLVQFLVSSAEAYFSEHPPRSRTPARINKLVLAVPNTFTPGKIHQMKECCFVRPGIHVDHIYEAEAVLVYYLWRQDQFISAQRDKVFAMRETTRGERVLVFDFGGGSVNFTYAALQHRRNDTDVTVHQRLGFSLGGDHLDRAIADYLWTLVSADVAFRGKLDPHREDPTDDDRRLRCILLQVASRLKCRLADQISRGSADAAIPLEGASVFAAAFNRCRVTAESVLNSPELQSRLHELAEGARELVELCRDTGAWQGVDTLIFTGRSTRFPGIKESVTNALAESQATCLEWDDVKTCVAQGAALWGMQKNRIRLLRRQAAFAHYGLARYESYEKGSRKFIPLLTAGAIVPSSVDTQPMRYEYNNNGIELYQIMGANPDASLKDDDKYARLSLLGRFKVDTETIVQRIHFDLQPDDTFRSVLYQDGAIRDLNADINLRDIGEDADKTALWLVT